MKYKLITNKAEHEALLREYDSYLEIVMDKGEENAPEDILEKMGLLGLLINEYENKVFPIPKIDPIDAIKFEMDQQHLRPTDMAEYFGTASRFYDIINGKRKLSLNMIKKLHEGLNIPYDCLIAQGEFYSPWFFLVL